MSLRNPIGKSAIVAAFVLTVAACAPALQGGVTSRAGAAAGQMNRVRQQDPNMPPLIDQSGAPISWLLINESLWVHFKKTGAYCVYLGFNEKGSYIQNQGDGKVYLWNLKANSLSVVANNFKEIPLDVLASLQNSDVAVQYWLAANDKSRKQAPIPQQQGGAISSSGAAAGQTYRGPEHDPNLPPLVAPNDAPISWSYGSGTVPSVSFKNPPYDAVYLGFNENGSLILNQGNLKLFYWKLTDPNSFSGTLTLTLAVKSYKDVPLDLLASLQNPSSTVTETLVMNGKGPKPATIPQQQTAQNSDKSAGLFGDNPQKALQGLAPAAGSPADIAGKNAAVQGGVLTFTLADGTRSKPYSVARPAFMANAPQAAGIAGTWIAMESGGKAMMFNVQGDNSVTGKEISPQVVQMLMQRAPKPQ
jgi:hypothetical protein